METPRDVHGGGKFQDRNFKQGQEFLAFIQVFKDCILNPCEFVKSASRYGLFFWSDEPVKLDTDFVASLDKAKGNLW